MKSIFPKRLRRTILIAFAATFLLLAGWMIIIARGELGEKEGYAVLQSAESDHRNDPNSIALVKIENFDGTAYDVAGISTDGASGPRFWLILNKVSAGGKVFSLPASPIPRINCQQVANVLNDDHHVHPKVRELLHTSCAA